jgi:glycosyltransferase involved in cell wall biosynthesis
MKILFAIKNMNNAKGGAERVLSFVVNGLVERGHEITLLTFDERGLDTFYQLDHNIKRVSLGIGHAEKKAGLFETIARMRAIRRVVQVRKPDIIVPFMHSMFIPTAFALIGVNVPIIASEHIVPMHYKKKRHEFLLLILSSFCVQRITVLSETVKKMYPSFVRKKMVVMPNPVYINQEDMSLENSDPTRKIILNVGRLSDQKDQKTLIRAFAKIADKYPEWDVRIVGEGEHRDFLHNLINELNLTTRVHLIGTTHNIAQEYKIAQIFAMPSKYESFGLATAEAMSFGIPAVGFIECAGTNEIVEHQKNGILAKRSKNHIQNYSEALEILIKNKRLRKKLGKKAKNDIIRYQPSLIVDRWDNLIQDIHAK